MRDDRIQGIISFSPRTVTVQLPPLEHKPLAKRLGRRAVIFSKKFKKFVPNQLGFYKESDRRPPIASKEVKELLNRLRSF